MNLDLPRGMQFKHGGYYLTTRVEKKLKWIQLGREREKAIQEFARMRDYYAPGAISDRAGWARAMLRRAKGRSRRYDVPCTINLGAIMQICESQRWRCALTGLTFSMSKPNGARLAPMAPSLDRVDSSKGYEPGNCRIVVLAMNIALNEWGDTEFHALVAAFTARQGVYKMPRKFDTLSNR